MMGERFGRGTTRGRRGPQRPSGNIVWGSRIDTPNGVAESVELVVGAQKLISTTETSSSKSSDPWTRRSLSINPVSLAAFA